MTDSATLGHRFKVAFKDAVKGLFATDDAVLVSFGASGPRGLTFDDVIGVADLSVGQAVATLGTNRSREETLELTVWVSSHLAGDVDDLEEQASERAHDLLRQIEHYVRQTDTTLGGLVRDCTLTRYDATGFMDQAGVVAGRTVDIEATFTAHARVSGP